MAGVIAFVGIGSNLEDPRAQVLRAIGALAAMPHTTPLRRSSLYRSAPVDAPGPEFVNAVVELRTSLPALALLHELQAIEQRHGRVRGERNAPRTLDLDLLLYGDERRDDAELQLPHPRLHRRAFVLEPLLEIEPRLSVPGLGPLGDWRAAVADQALERIAEPAPTSR